MFQIFDGYTPDDHKKTSNECTEKRRISGPRLVKYIQIKMRSDGQPLKRTVYEGFTIRKGGPAKTMA